MDTVRVPGADIAEITNVLNRCMLAVDQGDGRAFSSCFTHDGTCEVVVSGANKAGHAELAGLCMFLHEKFPTCRHWEGNVCVTGSVLGATNRSYWKALDGGEVVSTGIHEDQLVRPDDVWLISKRVIRHTWTKAGGHIPEPK
jgi:hypothetical protein